LYLHGSLSGERATAVIKREVHLVDNLAANLLIGVDILAPEAIKIDMKNELMTLGNCKGITVPIRVTPRGGRTKVYVRASKRTIIQPGESQRIGVTAKALPTDRDLLFEPDCPLSFGANGGLATLMVDSHFNAVSICNATPDPITVQRSLTLGYVTDFDEEGAFPAEPSLAPLALTNQRLLLHDSPQDQPLEPHLIAGSANPIDSFNQAYLSEQFLISTLDGLQSTLCNGIVVYGDSATQQALIEVCSSYPSIWGSPGFVHLPVEDYMRVPLIPNWEEKAKFSSRVYPLSQQAKDLVDETFDKLHEQGKMVWSSKSSPIASPIFVV